MDDTYARKILFRGKRVDNGKWVYGFPCYAQCLENVSEPSEGVKENG